MGNNLVSSVDFFNGLDYAKVSGAHLAYSARQVETGLN